MMIGGTTIGIGVGIRRPSLPGGFLKRRPSVPGFVGGWKAYGRSNDEDADTRKYLKDYSGNGRDIELFNFAFAGMSGYGGYRYDQSNMIVVPVVVSYCKIEGNKIEITNLSYSDRGTVCYARSIYGEHGQPLSVNVPAYKIKVSGLSEGQRVDIGRGYNNGVNTSWVSRVISSIDDDGIYEIPAWNTVIEPANEEVRAFISDFRPAVYATEDTPANVVIEVLPDYPGALVSDGIDDYGQCIKDFALPDDYTVVAIRKPIKINSNGLVAKGSNQGAFVFESVSNYSYGAQASITDKPALFSYMMKNSYNGTAIESGTAVDDENDKLRIFTHNLEAYQSAALYDLRIYDHSLTAEELQTVKYEMMSDFEAGAMQDVTYVADWDAKGRSNDEEEPARSKWVDKVNGRILNLNNFAFAAESGWNGYRLDWSTWKTDREELLTKILTGNKVTFSNIENYLSSSSYPQINFFKRNYLGTSEIKMRVRVSGMKEGESCGWSVKYTEDQVNYTAIPNSTIRQNGEVVFTAPPCYTLLCAVNNIVDGNNREITIEQLPLYPGALVSDGVDDSGVAQDNFTEPIGTMIAHIKDLGMANMKYVFNTDFAEEGRLYLWKTDDHLSAGIPSTPQEPGAVFALLTRESSIPSGPLRFMVGNYSALYRLIFIKEKLDAAQLEFLEWKVGKEYREWCKENGYEYAMEEMLNN